MVERVIGKEVLGRDRQSGGGQTRPIGQRKKNRLNAFAHERLPYEVKPRIQEGEERSVYQAGIAQERSVCCGIQGGKETAGSGENGGRGDSTD